MKQVTQADYDQVDAYINKLVKAALELGIEDKDIISDEPKGLAMSRWARV
jgi:hypothetical protein